MELVDATIAFAQVKAEFEANYNAWLTWFRTPGRKPEAENVEREHRYQHHSAAVRAAQARLEKAQA